MEFEISFSMNNGGIGLQCQWIYGVSGLLEHLLSVVYRQIKATNQERKNC